MATMPTPEEIGMQILSLYAEHKVRPGEMLMLRNINLWWMNLGGRGDDLVAGLEWLGEKGYLEQQAGKSSDVLFLTQAGFDAM